MIKSSVLFLCTGNPRRTQMAEGFLRALAGDDFEVASAGSEETPLDPDAVAAMREVGIDFGARAESGKPLSRPTLQLRGNDVRPPEGVELPDFPWCGLAPAMGSDDSSLVAAGDRRQTMCRVRDDIQRHVMDFVKKNGVTKAKEQPA